MFLRTTKTPWTKSSPFWHWRHSVLFFVRVLNRKKLNAYWKWCKRETKLTTLYPRQIRFISTMPLSINCSKSSATLQLCSGSCFAKRSKESITISHKFQISSRILLSLKLMVSSNNLIQMFSEVKTRCQQLNGPDQLKPTLLTALTATVFAKS